MQACEGYVENGQFFPIGAAIKTSGRLRAFLTILDEPVQDKDTMRRLAALDEFFSEIAASDEDVPAFEPVMFSEVEI